MKCLALSAGVALSTVSITITILLHHLHFGVVSGSNIDFIRFTTEFSDTQFLLKDDVDF